MPALWQRLRSPRSIRWRLLLWLALALWVSALVVGGITWRAVAVEAQTLFDYQLRQMALSLRDRGGGLPEQAEVLEDEQLDFVVQIWSLEGRPILTSRPHGPLPDRVVLGLADMRVAGEVWRSYAVIGRGRVIQVAQPERIRRELATAAALRSVAPIAWLGLPLMALLWVVVARGLSPLRQLADSLATRDTTHLHPLPSLDVPEELVPLVASLNDWLSRLAQALQAQQAFVADAAHELRSPLTALKLQWQLVRRACDEVDRAEAIAALGEGIERTARLVEQLLALARNEGPEVRTAVDLTELARQVLVALLPVAQARHTALALEAPHPAPVWGDGTALGVLLRNLVDNAVRYSPPGSQVKLCIQPATATQGPQVRVEDNGPGIPPEERQRVFDRFYRGRTGHDTAGSGLGLAIVQAVAQRHGARIALEDVADGGLCVRVSFMAMAPSSVGDAQERQESSLS
jgi:signal transduction histidine kinase